MSPDPQNTNLPQPKEDKSSSTDSTTAASKPSANPELKNCNLPADFREQLIRISENLSRRY